MIKRIIISIVGLMVLLGLTACGNQANDVAKDITWQKYVSQDKDFSINAPADWVITDESSAYVSVDTPDGNSWISFTLDRGIGSYELDEYAAMWYEAGSTNATLLSSSKLVIGGTIAAREYTEGFADDENAPRKGTEVFFVSGGNGYRVYAESPLAVYDNYLPVFNSIINSFRVTDVSSSKVTWKTVTYTEAGLSFNIPRDWWEQASATSVRLYGAGNDTTGTLSSKESNGATVEEMNAATYKSFQDLYPMYEVVSERMIVFGGMDAVESVMVFNNGYAEFKGKAVAFVMGGWYFRASFSARPGLFDFYEPTWDAIMESINLAQ
jgi:hypothetical protein